jgi:hypothetical protein
MDASGSMGLDNFVVVKKFASGLMDRFEGTKYAKISMR